MGRQSTVVSVDDVTMILDAAFQILRSSGSPVFRKTA
jgi:hypothetical protein